ncbi:MAG: glycosyltransferase [Pseudomonadota bacterium]
MAEAAVIIPHYNDAARLGTCLAALMPQVADRPVEVAVIDNGSTEDLSDLRARHPGVLWLSEAEKGAAPARNAGVAGTGAPCIFFLDCDCVPAPDWIETALALSGGDELIGGRVDVFDETPPPRSGAEAFETVFAFPQASYIADKGFSVTANLLTSRTVWDAVGGFRVGTAEDYDWCRRAGAAGYPIRYADGLAVAHPTRQDWTALRRKWVRITNEGFTSHGTTPARRVSWALRSGAVLGSALVHAPRVLGHAALTGGEKGRGLATLLRLRALRTVWMLRQAATGRTV